MTSLFDFTSFLTFTYLKIYNRTPKERSNRDLRVTLPINKLKEKERRFVPFSQVMKSSSLQIAISIIMANPSRSL